jgi:hypothetical protein
MEAGNYLNTTETILDEIEIQRKKENVVYFEIGISSLIGMIINLFLYKHMDYI